jgi:hypothetical protein
MGKTIVAGLVGAMLITAFALHASQLSTLGNSIGTNAPKIVNSVETG